jgi:hypothetical protein
MMRIRNGLGARYLGQAYGGPGIGAICREG